MVDFNGVFQASLRKDITNAMLGELFQVVGGCAPVQDDPLPIQPNGQIANAASGSILHLPFQLSLQLRNTIKHDSQNSIVELFTARDAYKLSNYAGFLAGTTLFHSERIN